MNRTKFHIEKPECTDIAAGSWIVVYPAGFSDTIHAQICKTFDEAIAAFIAAELRWCPMCGKGSVVHVSWGWICEDCGANDVAAGQTKPPPHPISRADRQGTICEDYELNGCGVDTCPEGCYLALRSPQCCGGGPQWGHAFTCPSLP